MTFLKCLSVNRAKDTHRTGPKTASPPMASSYLDQPVLPLAITLPGLLENIEAELTNENLEPAQKDRLRQRGELIQWLLGPRHLQ